MATCEYCNREFGPTEGGTVPVRRRPQVDLATICDTCFEEQFYRCAICGTYTKVNWTSMPAEDVLKRWYGDRWVELDSGGPAFLCCDGCLSTLLHGPRPPWSVARMEWRAHYEIIEWRRSRTHCDDGRPIESVGEES